MRRVLAASREPEAILAPLLLVVAAVLAWWGLA